jgi:uncharacterized protein YecT (DUF1311 family)
MILLPALIASALQVASPQQAEESPAGNAAAAGDESLFGPEVSIHSDDGRPVCVRDGNTLELNACGADDLKLEEARMQRYLDAAMDRASGIDNESGEFGEPTQLVAWLSASQQSWTAYAEIRCDGVLDQWKGGTVRTLVYLGCKIDATRQRTHDIWSDYLTYWDTTPPVLPEPVMTVPEENRGDEAR